MKFEHTNKRAGWNIHAGGNFSSKSINVQSKIRQYRVEFFSIRYTRVLGYLKRIYFVYLGGGGREGDLANASSAHFLKRLLSANRYETF